MVAAIRARVGPDVLISASLDLHGNIGPDLVEPVDILTAFRTAPHRDADVTRRRAIRHLERCIRTGMRPRPVLIKVPLLLPGEFAITEIEPARTLYRMLDEIDAVPGILDSSLLIGYAWADSPHASVSVIVVAEQDRSLARRHAVGLAAAAWEQRVAFRSESAFLGIDEAIALARSLPEYPVFLSDAGDNVTAGEAGDIPLITERLLAAGVSDAVVVGICDADAVALCGATGVHGAVTTTLGGKLDPIHGTPLSVTGVVAYLDSAEDPSGSSVPPLVVAQPNTPDQSPIASSPARGQPLIGPAPSPIQMPGLLLPSHRSVRS